MLALVLVLLFVFWFIIPLLTLLPTWFVIVLATVTLLVALFSAGLELVVQWLTIKILRDQWKRNQK